MKKTLIALAVLAASGASFAQVTISGNLTMGYAQATVANSDTSGLGTDTSEIDFAATESLGGGKTITAKLALAGADRSNESTGSASFVSGRDASLTLATNSGNFILGSGRSVDYLSGGVAGVGAVYFTMDSNALATGSFFSARSSRDTATYNTGTMLGGLTLTLSAQEGANNQGLAAGAAGLPVAQRLTVYGANYKTGAIVVDAQLLSYDQSSTGTDATTKNVQRLSGSYDLGVAKLGAGVQVQNNVGVVNASSATQTLIGIAVPVGAVSLGGQWGQRKTADYAAAATNGTRTGYSLAAVYSLSKRTAVLAQYSRWDNANFTNADSMTGVLLSHSF
jgi:hypothetical protein